MKRTINNLRIRWSLPLWLGVLSLPTMAQEQMPEYRTPEVEILGTMPGVQTPVTQQRIDVPKLNREKITWDLPSLLEGTPSLYVISDAGIMGGYTSFSIRGVDPGRINITNNGVPLNDSESQLVFWANMPDFGSRLDKVVIVRGVGSSTFGAGAFGATMEMTTARPESSSGGSVAYMRGMYGLDRRYVHLETGALPGGWAIGAHLSQISSDGYVERSGGKGTAYLINAAWVGDHKSLHIIVNSGTQQTGVAWNGTTPEEMAKYGRTFNSAGLINPDFEDKGEKPHYYPNTDNYRQTHTQLLWKQELNPNWRYGITLHHTYGMGYTHEYRTGRKAREYGLGKDKTLYDLVRNKYLENNFGGVIGTLEFMEEAWKVTAGVAGNIYLNDHWGDLPYVKGKSLPTRDYPFEYYRNHSRKYDLSGYVKAEYSLGDALLYLDYMYRHITHSMKGSSDKWDSAKQAQDQLDYDLKYNFHLPKAGIRYSFLPNLSAYASVQMGAKEPNRRMYTESKRSTNKSAVLPKPEHMTDFEAGLQYSGERFRVMLNGYYMKYRDQLVNNGEYSDVGEPILINVPDSYRAGIEAGVDLTLLPQLSSTFNINVSTNKIKDFTQVVDGVPFHYDLPTIAQSPSLLFNEILRWSPTRSWDILMHLNYVGKRYIDNTQVEELSIPAYMIGKLVGNYTWRLPHERELRFTLQVNNLFNKKYSSNIYGGSWVEKEDGKPVLKYWTAEQPSAPIHIVGGVTFQF